MSLMFVLGLAMLLGGGYLLVRGASGFARALGVSPLIVGLTIVAFGTSTPELAVNIAGSSAGHTGIAFGNVVGSNLANIGLVLGLAALVSPITLQGRIVRHEVPLLLLATSVLVVMSLDGPLLGRLGIIDRSEGLVLFLLFTVFIYIAIQQLAARVPDPVLAGVENLPDVSGPGRRLAGIVYLVLGLVLLSAGGFATVNGGVALAESLGVRPVIIGIVAVAVGTSLPELATSVIAAARGEPDLALGNVVGSNIFNGLIVLPTSAVIDNLRVPVGGVTDLGVSFMLTAMLIPAFVWGKATLGRTAGALLLAAYVVYVVLRAVYPDFGM